VFEAYQEGAKSAGMPTGPDRVAIRRAITVVADESQLDKAHGEAMEGVEEFSRVSHEAMKIPDATLHVDKDELIIGTPEQVADEIIRQCTTAGVGNFLAMFNVFDANELRNHHELFGREVIPRLRAAQVG
jgi:alkanesulfonate monooxygenase SsuD/methylene tetrahydromethanopterin reductase-like flavin-dependent oxidoreductase (luciferase family)